MRKGRNKKNTRNDVWEQGKGRRGLLRETQKKTKKNLEDEGDLERKMEKEGDR